MYASIVRARQDRKQPQQEWIDPVMNEWKHASSALYNETPGSLLSDVSVITTEK